MAGARRKPVQITEDNVHEFLDTFDVLVSDCDGVVWTPLEEIPNSRRGLDSLRAAGKKVLFASNNSVQPIIHKFERLGFSVQKDDVVHPALALAHHLRQIGFKKKAFVLATENFKQYIRETGVTIVPQERNEPIVEDLKLILESMKDEPEIGAVILDLDVNVAYIELMRAIHYLQNPDCLFFVGATDTHLPFGKKVLVGPGIFLRLIEEVVRRKAVMVGKPGPMMLKDYLLSLHNLNIQRTLFVGDTLLQDMGVASNCGMKSLLVLTGMTRLEDLDTCDPNLIPDYYIPSIGDFANLLTRRKA